MAEKLTAPQGLTATGKDGAVYAEWSEVEGADGYRLFYYEASDPDNCIKTRYAQRNGKTILGFKNGTEYLMRVCAFKTVKGKEVLGEMSEKVSFVPICETLKAQNSICLETGASGQLVWEYRNTVPKAAFASDNGSIAQVDGNGKVTAVSSGETYITITAEGEQFRTRVCVDRDMRRGGSSAVIMLTGDIMCAIAHQRAAEKYQFDFHDSFSGIKETLAKADFAAGVLETTCYDGAPYEYEAVRLPGGSPNCNSPSTFLTALADAGFNALVTANNHNCDTGSKGLRFTIDEIKRLGMTNLGTMGSNPVIVDVKGIKVAFICCCMISNGLESVYFAGGDILVGQYSREFFLELVNGAMRMGAEYIIAYQHWGTMNSSIVRKIQKEEARFMAEAGADLIVGSHPHAIQRFEYIKTPAGKRVPCAYSLGNFLTSMAEMKENRDSVILRAELSKDAEGKVSASLSYIPCISEDREYGVCVLPSFPPHSFAAQESYMRTRAAIGKSINHFEARPKVLLSGSAILRKIFNAGRGFRVDPAGLLQSQVTACGEPDYEIPEIKNDAVRTDVEKSLPAYMKESSPDYIAVDFYTAASAACYQLDECLFTGSKNFLKSSFARERKSELVRLPQPLDESLWRERITLYAKAVLEAVPSERVVLFRQRFRDKRAVGTELRNAPSQGALNRRIEEMEDLFISLVHPAVVDLSTGYMNTGNSLSSFESGYFTDAYNAFHDIVFSGRRCVHLPDTDIWFDRVMKYYNNMTARGFQGWLMDMNCAADKIIAYTNKEFAAEHCNRLIKLKKSGTHDLLSTRNFFVADAGASELIEAAEIIYAVLEENLTGPYEFYELAFKRKFRILKAMAKQLSNEVKAPVSEDSAELVFLLRGTPKLKLYIANTNRCTIDIWGSCVSREAIKYSSGTHVGKYIFKQAPVLAFEPPIDVEIPEDAKQFSGNKWRASTIASSLKRDGLQVISGSQSKWLMVDLYDLICKMTEYNGALFEIDEFIVRTEFYRGISGKCRDCSLFEKRDMKYCFDMITKFANAMSEKYGGNIILIKAEPKNTYINMEGRTAKLSDDGLYDIRKKFISLCEERFATVTECYVIDISRRFYASDSFPLGGAHMVHYEEEFYRLAGEYISEIVRGTERHVFDSVDEDYLLLRSMRAERE